MMKDRLRDFPLTVEEVRRLIKKEDAKRATWFALGVSVVAILVGLVIWIAKRREKDLEEHYEYFDEDFDELDEDLEDFDDSIYDDADEEEKVEYVQINDFMKDDSVSNDTKEETESEVKEEVVEETK